LADVETGPSGTVIGRRTPAPLLVAALSNGISVHVEDYDDTCLPSVLHPSAPIIPAALAAAEFVDASGELLLEGAIVGMEVAIRIADGLGTRARDRGWHITGLVGPIGAAAAAGRILGLSEQQVLHALGIAASQGAGVVAALGTMTKSLHPGRAAANGLEAAFLARAGVTGPLDGIATGIARAAADWLDESRVTAQLGNDWRISSNRLKPYACGVVSHPAIDAATRIRSAFNNGETVQTVTHVQAGVHPLVLDAMGIQRPQTNLQAKFSIYHCIAVGLLDGVGGPEEFSLERVRSSDVRRVRELVDVNIEPACKLDEVSLTVQFADGHLRNVHIDSSTGQGGLTDSGLETKVHELADERIGRERVSYLLERTLQGPPPSATELVALAGPPENQVERNGDNHA
jgi:2-methylcitrate dehydratase PrpD